ncbi:MAG: barstar family protein [Dehalococcoidia bacterium]|nr:barstar family protein [Dehalococcoidia bacterium]
MYNWTTTFSSALHSGVYALPSGRSAGAVKKAASYCDLEHVYIDLRAVKDKTDFLKTTARALYFPEYFGMNWDALGDCLTDLSWKTAGGYVIVFNNFGIFARNDRAGAGTAVKVFGSSAMHWKQKGMPFFIIL